MSKATAKRAAKKTQMHSTQEAYAVARAAYEAAIAAYNAECQAAGAFDSDEDWAFEMQEDLSAKHSTSRLFDAVRQAERAVVAWSLQAAKRHATAAQASELEVRSTAERHPKVWAKLVEQAFRLAA